MRVAIVGGGIGGLAVAIALARLTDVETVVYERRPIDPGIGFAVNLAPNGMRVLAELGLADRVLAAGRVLRTWEMRHSSGQIITRFPLLFEREYGYPMVAVRRELLLDTLYRAAADARVDLRLGSEVIGVDNLSGGVAVGLRDGTTEDSDAVVVCDGARSRIRAQLLGDHPSIPTGQGQSFGISDPDDQFSGLKHTFATMLGRAGRYFGGYDIGRGQVLWFVGYPTRSPARAAMPATDPTVDYSLGVIRRLTSGWCPPVPQVIEGTTRFGTHACNVQTPPSTLWLDRVVLLGDAALAVQPHFGQGANLALEDAITLARLLDTRTGRDTVGLTGAFSGYSRIRLPRRLVVRV